MNKGLLLLSAALLLLVPATEGRAAVSDTQQASPQKKITVKGTVVDAESLPVIGATVMVAGHPDLGGTMTSDKGEFSFDVPAGMSLQISCIGYDTQTIAVQDATSLFITLEENTEFLDEVVVVGYGVQTKESIVGAISTVSSESVANTGSNLLASALNGKVSGMSQILTSGAPGEDTPEIFLRGLSSMNGSQPLVMVDGVERSMNEVSPNDVASISVLKDASATAVFGAKGANGVILVTTKTGLQGRPKMTANVEYGTKSMLRIPEHISSYTTVQMANVALQNDNSFGSMYSDKVLEAYRTQSDPYRYPDVNWYDEMFKKFSPTYNASFSLQGGSDKVTYYTSINYYHEGSITKDLSDVGARSNFSSDRLTYRVNLDAKLTKSTTLNFKLGGVTTINNGPQTGSGTVNVGTLFSTMFQATGAVYPAYFPEDIYELYPDPNYPDAHERRLASSAQANFENPMRYLLFSKWYETTTNKINTDLQLTQNLDFITKGLSAKVLASMTSSYSRNSQNATNTEREWSIDWARYDLGVADIWNTSASDVSNVYVESPLSVSQSTSATSVNFIFYFEGALNYARSFGKHNVSAMATYNQRQYNSGASSPKRNQAAVGRVTYNYAKKYLFEANAGFTGSEQFAPAYRYGFFPSAAVGYVVSNEKFWKSAMPWWNTMKIRYSDGLVGSDSGNSGFIYYNSYTQTTMANGAHYLEGAAANETARWETAHKRDLGFEMGWLKNDLTLNVDLWDEYRSDILMTPVTTPLLGVKFKDTNCASLKKHGLDIDLNYRHIYANGFSYSIGALFGVNENRIVDYPDITYAPQYQKQSGTPYKSQNKGSTLIDDKYFQTINEIHGYSTFTTSWSKLAPGTYKFLDYRPDGIVDDSDLHTIGGVAYPPCTYSANIQLGYKGWTFRMVGTGTVGKYLKYPRGYMIPFLSKELKVHVAQVDYWTPTNRNAAAPVLTFDDSMYAWGGGSSAHPGYDLALEDYTWRNSDYFDISEVYLAYRYTAKKNHTSGIDGFTVSLTVNNLCIFTDLPEGNPMAVDIASTKYPLMRTAKLGFSLNF